MNRRGFLGSLIALVAAPKAVAALEPPTLSHLPMMPKFVAEHLEPLRLRDGFAAYGTDTPPTMLTPGELANPGWSMTVTAADLEGAQFWYAPEQRWYVVGAPVT